MTEGMELLNQETYKYSGILGADTIKQVEMKEKGEQESYSKPNCITGTI